jgi:uncharacterized membrane protein
MEVLPVAFCKSCGQDIGTSAFCPKCGASQSAAASPAAAPIAAPMAASSEGLAENIAGLLCYLPGPGWIIALVLFLIDKRPFVRFRATQSLILSVAMIVFGAALGIFMGMLHMMHIFFLGLFFYPLLWLAIFILLIFMMYKAYLNEKYKLPVIGDMAEGFASK